VAPNLLLQIMGKVHLPIGENSVTQRQLAHIVKQPADAYIAYVLKPKSQPLGKAHGIKGHPMTMGQGIAIFLPQGQGNFT
jgi:hypothetical protein